MGNYNFAKDLKASEKSVSDVITCLERMGFSEFETNNDGRYDISYTTVSGAKHTAEVKNDLMWDKTGNVAIEYKSRGKASGIATSKADYWFYVLGEKIYHAPVGDIRVYLIQHWDRFKRLSGGDEGTSQLALLKLDDFKDIFKEL